MKFSGAVSAGIYSEPLGMSRSKKLPDNCGVFQAILLAIEATVERLQNMHVPTANIAIVSDKQTAVNP